ncbi:hypothetical protein [Phenylobacterium sp.]|jgi:hypothetical protein|uniref:hypothetical protein n=1 Tax=Phenylobacterium sp. TaxID=1871053 RepID=UPI002F40F5EB
MWIDGGDDRRGGPPEFDRYGMRDKRRRVISLVRNTPMSWETAALICEDDPAVAGVMAKLLQAAAPPHLKRRRSRKSR